MIHFYDSKTKIVEKRENDCQQLKTLGKKPEEAAKLPRVSAKH